MGFGVISLLFFSSGGYFRFLREIVYHLPGQLVAGGSTDLASRGRADGLRKVRQSV